MRTQGTLSGKVAIITGSSRGIGAAIASTLAEEGAAVVVNYLSNHARAEAVVEGIQQRGGAAVAMQADVTNRADVERMVSTTLDEFRTVDILVNNAHRTFVPKPFRDVTWTDIQEQVDGIIGATFNCCQTVLKSMAQKRSGRIINVGSITVESPALAFGGGFLARNTAKAALIGFSRTLALEVAPYGITVNMVSPGWTNTEQAGAFPQEVRQQAADRVPMGRLATAEDIARVVLFFASDWSGFVTGSDLPVCGGAIMR